MEALELAHLYVSATLSYVMNKCFYLLIQTYI